MSSFLKNAWKVPALGMLVFAAACGGADANPAPADVAVTDAPATQVPTPAEAHNEAIEPAPTGEVIEVRMVMPGGQNPLYEPANITARPGDVIRFVNVENVHNVSFPPAGNPSGVDLPAPSPYLTQPGQTWELQVDLPAGTYKFICVPHLAMGMTGTLTVTE